MQENYERPKTLNNTRIIFDREAYSKILYFVDKSYQEVSGLGKVIREADGTFLVKDVMMLPQKNTMGSTDIDATDVAKAQYEMRNTPGELNFWWHSHVDMDVFWSGTDIDTIASIGGAGYVVASVFNKRREQKNAIYCNLPFGETPLKIFLPEMPHQVVTYLPKATFDLWDAEYEKNVKKNFTLAAIHGGDSARDRWRTWRAPQKVTKYDTERGFMYEVDKDDIFWKVSLDVDGNRTSRTPGHPHWLNQEEAAEQVILVNLLKATSEENQSIMNYYND